MLTEEKAFELAHRMLLDTPARRFWDIEVCEACSELIIKEAQRVAGETNLKQSAVARKVSELTIDDVWFPQPPDALLNGFSQRLLREHDHHNIG